MLDLSPNIKNQAQEILGQVYAHWQGYSSSLSLACGPGCAVCCTDRVFMTTLEAEILAQELTRRGRGDLLDRVLALPLNAPPQATHNQAAQAMIKGIEPPGEDELPEAVGSCPLLEDGFCAAYGARPLACRLMVSQQVCQEGGTALQAPLWPLLATALCQVVEHLDHLQKGRMGLMPAALAAIQGRAGDDLVSSQPLPGIPAPREHQAAVQGFLGRLFARPVQGRPLGQWLEPDK